MEFQGDATLITVTDNGRGFWNIADAYTLMGDTPKRMYPTKRGRFNTGGKTVIVVALEATVETVGTTLTFPRTGPGVEARIEEKNDRTSGTVVRVLMPWNGRESEKLISDLLSFMPPGDCSMYLNGVQIPSRISEMIFRASLPTVVQKDMDSPMRESPRLTDIHLVSPADLGDERRLYEMGIPVDTIACPWDVDIMQKIPLGESRDTVKASYITKVYTVILNDRHQILERDEFASEWVKRAIESGNATPEAVRSTVRGRWGNQVVFSTLNRNADARARHNEYAVVSPQSLSKKEVQQFRQHAGILDSDVMFPDPKKPKTDYGPPPGTDLEKFADWVRDVGVHCGLASSVRYFDESQNEILADCTAATSKLKPR